MAVTIKWLPVEAIDTTATAITSLDFGQMVRPSEKVLDFKIGNTGASVAEQVQLKAVGSDAEAVAWKRFSKDGGTTYTTTAFLDDIPANGITTGLKIKTTIPADATLGTHTTSTRLEYVYA